MQHSEEGSLREQEIQKENNLSNFGEAYLNKLLRAIDEDESGTVNKAEFIAFTRQMSSLLEENQNKSKNLEESNKHLAGEIIKLRKEKNSLITRMDALANERESFTSQIDIQPQKQNLLNLNQCKRLFQQIESLLNFINQEFQKSNPDFQAMMLMERLIYYFSGNVE